MEDRRAVASEGSGLESKHTCESKATFTNNGNTARTFGFQAGEDKGQRLNTLHHS